MCRNKYALDSLYSFLQPSSVLDCCYMVPVMFQETPLDLKVGCNFLHLLLLSILRRPDLLLIKLLLIKSVSLVIKLKSLQRVWSLDQPRHTDQPHVQLKQHKTSSTSPAKKAGQQSSDLWWLYFYFIFCDLFFMFADVWWPLLTSNDLRSEKFFIWNTSRPFL